MKHTKRIHKNKPYKCKLLKNLILLSEWICQDDLTQQDSNNKIFSRRRITVSLSTFIVCIIIIFSSLVLKHKNIFIKAFVLNDCDFLICQITSSFLIMSIISLLNEKGEVAYWTNTMTYMFKRPVLIGIRALSRYIFFAAIISSVSFLLNYHNIFFSSFIFSNIFLVIIIYRLIKVYYDKNSVLLRLECRFAAMKLEYKMNCIKTLRTSTINAFLERESNIYIENCKFLFKLYYNTSDYSDDKNTKIIKLSVKKSLNEILTLAFSEFKEDWVDLYLDIRENLVDSFSNDPLFNSHWKSFCKKNYTKLFYYGIYFDKSYYTDPDLDYENFSNKAEMILNLIEKKDTITLDFAGIDLWNNPDSFDVYFAKTLFIECSIENNEIKYTLRKNVADYLRENLSHDSLLGFYYSIYVFEKAAITKQKFSENTYGFSKQKIFEDLLSSLSGSFYEMLDGMGYLVQIDEDKNDLSSDFKKELDNKFNEGKYDKYYLGPIAEWNKKE